ncbi:YhfC family intramembrane metalloprotease [bacterium]|nr:YhfC family intramembrane metalloprotease [bacterium]
MLWLSVAIVVAILVTVVLPVGVIFWLNKKFVIPLNVIMYGVIAYFLAQVVVTLVFTGFNLLVENGTLALSGSALTLVQVGLSVALGAIVGVLIRWAGMKFLKENLDNPEAAFAVGVSYGAAESILLVGLPLISTFFTMMTNLNIDPATTSLDPAMVAQLEQLWLVSPLVPLLGSIERLSALIMHLAVTFLILQVFLRGNPWFLALAIADELLVNGVVVSMSEAGIANGWLALVSLVLGAANLYLLYLLKAFDLKRWRIQEPAPKSMEPPSPIED